MHAGTGAFAALAGCAGILAGCTHPVTPIAQAGVARDFSAVWVPIPDNPEIGLYADVGTIELNIKDFYPRKLARNVTVEPRGGRKTSQPKQDFGKRKTLWDIDAQGLCTGTAKQKVKVNIIIDTGKNVFFQQVEIGGRPSAPIGAADVTSAAAFSGATLPTETSPGIWTASFWLLCEATPVTRLSKFNLALHVRDSVEIGYGLPLIVDPIIRNRAG